VDKKVTWEHVVERNEEHVKHGTLFAKNKLNHFDLQKSNLESYDINMQIQDEDTIEKYSSRCHLTFLPMLKFGQYFPFKCLLVLSRSQRRMDYTIAITFYK